MEISGGVYVADCGLWGWGLGCGDLLMLPLKRFVDHARGIGGLGCGRVIIVV